MNPIISIVIANYNYGRFLEDAIRSVLAQGMKDQVELIVCDGGSTDNSLEVIRKYKDAISWWCSEADDGQSAAFNKGFSHATGRYLTWLNADDVLMPGSLKAIVALAERYPKAEWLTGSSAYADRQLRITKCFQAHAFSELRARFGDLMVGGPSSFFTKDLLMRAGGIDESLHFLMDIDLWNKFYFKCGARYKRTGHYIFAYREHENSKMKGADISNDEVALCNRRRAHEESLRVARRYAKSSAWCRKIAAVLSFSPLDKIKSVRCTNKWRGHHAMEV